MQLLQFKVDTKTLDHSIISVETAVASVNEDVDHDSDVVVTIESIMWFFNFVTYR